jgi:carbamoyltransferase
MGFGARGEQHLEALARLAPGTRDDSIAALFSHGVDRVNARANWRSSLEALHHEAPTTSSRTQELAAAVQSQLGDILLALLHDVRRTSGADFLCLGGTFFLNTYFCGLAKRSGLFEQVYVPVDPGDSGLAAGSALAVTNTHVTAGPFLGPAWEPSEVKATLDNCKLNYDWSREDQMIERTVDALVKGQLVGWFQGAMESGRRALGARSILANPRAPHVLENLNGFLKQRPAWRGYALSGLESDVAATFMDSTKAPFMECDFIPVDPAPFHRILPSADASLRVQTVGEDAPPRFRRLLEAFHDLTGSSLLVNTSFNGFAEPIVCSPRDAIRVFFGTGLDMLVMDQFVLRK